MMVRATMGLLLLVSFVRSAPAAFTSLYVFGDGVCTTTNSPGGAIYHGKRYSNGRVWVEVLAERQGLGFDSNKNWSFFGHFSPNLVTNVSRLVAPADVNTSLFIVWVNNADFVDFLAQPQFAPYASNNIAVWTNAINQSLSNHLAAVQTLYAKGVRTLIMPNAVDLTKAPYYQLNAASEAFIRQRIADFNFAFSAQLTQLKRTATNLTIIMPDLFTLFDDLVAHPTRFGLTNSTGDALDDLANISFTGPGTNYLFWDYLHPTAKVHEVLADTTQQLISPARIIALAALGGSNQLTVANLPIGLPGFVESSPNCANWTQPQSFNSTGATQVILIPTSGPLRFYRLRFPFAWSWP